MVAHLPQASLQKILDRKPEMWRWLNLLSLESAALAVQALTDVLINDKERRCAAVLLRTAGCRDSGDVPATARLTQDELAALSNVSRPTVSTVVRRLAAQKFISLGYRSITIHSPLQLRRLLESHDW
jgi:CRP-like cAMP-binding protein